MPPPVRANRVDDVEVEQLDRVAGKAVLERTAKIPVVVIAQATAGALGVDDDRDRGVRTCRRGDLGDVAYGAEQLRRKVNAHHATQFSTVDGHQNEGLFGHEAENGGQRRDQRAGSVELEVGMRCRHATTIGACADQ